MNQLDHEDSCPKKPVETFHTLYAKTRVEAGDERCKLTIQFIAWMCSSIAITIATGVYLWNKDQDTHCTAPNFMDLRDDPTKWTDVRQRFHDVLEIFFALAITDWGRCVIMVFAIWFKSPALANLYSGLFINDVLAVGGVIVLHVFRFQLSGRICAGDFDEDPRMYPHGGNGILYD